MKTRTPSESPLDFRDADLQRANLGECFAPFTRFDGADLQWASLYEAYLHQSSFVGADLRKATLNGSGFFKSDFTQAKLDGAWLDGVDMREAVFRGASLVDADLSYAVFTDVNLESSTLVSCKVYGLSAWNIKRTPEVQRRLLITRDGEPSIEVDDLQVAQFVHLLLNHKNILKAFNAVSERGVLILGRFGGGGLEVLRAIADSLRELEYLPIIFDFDRPQDKTYTETIKTLAGLSRFVVVDLSGPSVPQELYATVPHFKIPFVPIIERRRRGYAMFVDLLEYDWVLKPIVKFEDTDALIDMLPEKIVEPAEARVVDRARRLREMFGEEDE